MSPPRAPGWLLPGALLLILVGLGALLAGRYLWPSGPRERVIEREVPVEVAKVPRRARKVPRRALPPARCESLTEIADAALLAEVARRHRLPDLAPSPTSSPLPVTIPRSLLTLVEARNPSRWGSEIAVTVGAGESEPTVTLVPLPAPALRPRFDWRLTVGLGGAASTEIDGTVAPAAYLAADLRLLQTGRLDHGLTVAATLTQDNPTAFAGYTVGWGDY